MPQSIEEITQRVRKAGEFIPLLNKEIKKNNSWTRLPYGAIDSVSNNR